MSDIVFDVQGQEITCIKPTVYGGSINYLQATFTFSSDWDGLTKIAHFTKGTDAIDLAIDANGRTALSGGLNLTTGRWWASVLGYQYSGETVTLRKPTGRIALDVKQSGMIDGAVMFEVTPSVYESYLAALTAAQEAAQAAAVAAQTAAASPARAVINQNGNTPIKMWVGTLTAYNDLATIESDTEYFIIEGAAT